MTLFPLIYVMWLQFFLSEEHSKEQNNEHLTHSQVFFSFFFFSLLNALHWVTLLVMLFIEIQDQVKTESEPRPKPRPRQDWTKNREPKPSQDWANDQDWKKRYHGQDMTTCMNYRTQGLYWGLNVHSTRATIDIVRLNHPCPGGNAERCQWQPELARQQPSESHF